MAIIKKKDLKKFKKEELDELVDVDGSPIEGDRNPTNDSEIEVAPQQTTDDYASSAIQPYRSLKGYSGAGYNTRHVGEEKMRTMLGKLLEFDNMEGNDINHNQIPDIQELSKTKPIVANKAQEVIDTIGKNNLNGDEIASLLNFILSNIDMNNISPEYRNMLKSKL